MRQTDVTAGVRRAGIRGAVLVVLAIACFAMAACGDSSDSSSSASGSTGSSQSSGSTSSGVAEATKIVDQYKQRPTEITVTAPVGKEIPTGKKIEFIDCGIPSCTDVGKSIAAAAKVLGWSYKAVVGSTDPAGAQKAFETVIQDKPDGVAYTGIAQAAVSKQLKQLESMKIPVATCCTTDEIGNGITNIARRAPSSALSGKIASSFIVSNSGGKANTLYVDLPVFPIYKPYRESFAENYKKLCDGCDLSTLSLPATAIGKDAPQRIASYLQSHPKINYVFVVNDGLSLGLPAALKSAGLGGKVKFVGSDPSPANLAAIAAGEELASVPAATKEFGWYEADILARAFVGADQPDVSELEATIWTKDNLPSTTDVVALNPNFEDQFKKLWGK
jgi:ABC-type sugar transport system substrate-binding protein